MHARVPAELKSPIEREIRRIRLNSALRLFLPVSIILAAAAYLGILWKGHALVYLLSLIFGDGIFQTKFLTYFVWSLFGCSAVATFFVFRHLVTKELYQDFLYCRRCDAFDFDEVGTCPVCRQPLKDKEAFFYLEFDDERKTLEAFGLRETRKAPNQSIEHNALTPE